MKLSVTGVSDALKKTGANVSATAIALGVSRTALYDFIAKHQNLKTILTDERESLVDVAEVSLKKQVEAGEAWAVCFALKTIGKNRGYVERVEQSGPNGGPVQIAPVDYRVAVKPITTENE